jgi:light-regulated signal transduction histidine kinase (bacteriophytochrome)
MAREIAESLQQRQPHRPVRWQVDDGLHVRADRALLHIALENLLENAWKFTAHTDEPVIRVGTAEHDGKPAYFVADNGAGFDMGYADRLFGAFQRMHHEREFPGTGIGLAIVQRIFHRHEAAVWAHSAPGRGATFYFRFRDTNDERSGQGHPAG